MSIPIWNMSNTNICLTAWIRWTNNQNQLLLSVPHHFYSGTITSSSPTTSSKVRECLFITDLKFNWWRYYCLALFSTLSLYLAQFYVTYREIRQNFSNSAGGVWKMLDTTWLWIICLMFTIGGDGYNMIIENMWCV